LAESRNLALAICWTIADLKRLPFQHFDAAVVERALWDGLKAPVYEQLAARFGTMPVLVVDPGLVAHELPGVSVITKAEGAASVLDAALGLARVHDHPPVLPH
jgi:hypothetical protein